MIKLEQEMREHAIAIKTLYEIASGIDKEAADNMIAGVKEYFEETGVFETIN